MQSLPPTGRLPSGDCESGCGEATPLQRRAGRHALVLNSYSLTGRHPNEHDRIRAFVDGLADGGYRAGHDVELEVVDSNDLAELEAQTREAVKRPTDVIHAVGTPNAIVAAHCGGGVPVVYYGAHPEGAGEAACRQAGVTGMVLTLPFTQNYKRFRFLRRLFPDVTRVWVPFYEGTVFCHEEMKASHRRHRTGGARTPWIPGGSPLVGYRSLASLCYIIGVEYRELVYQDLDDLVRGIERIDPEGALIMPYNDSVYLAGAPMALTTLAMARGIPLLWNNNTEATRIGAVAAFAGCFREAGFATGRMAASIMDGTPPDQIGRLTSTRTFSSLNLERARQLGLRPTPEVIARFDEVI